MTLYDSTLNSCNKENIGIELGKRVIQLIIHIEMKKGKKFITSIKMLHADRENQNKINAIPFFIRKI